MSNDSTVDREEVARVAVKADPWRKNAAGVKDGCECYRTINGVRWAWWAEDALVFKKAGVRHRTAPGGQGTFVHPDDDERALQAVDATRG